MDSVLVKRNGTLTDLSHILDESFRNLPMDFIIDGSNIIITNNYEIQTSLPEDFFEVNQNKKRGRIEVNETKATFVNNLEKKEAIITKQLIFIGDAQKNSPKGPCIISGKVRNKEDGQPVVGAQVYVKAINAGTITDASGYYALNIPKGENEIVFKFMGREDSTIPIMVYNNGSLNVDMEESNVLISEVVVTSEKENNLKNLNIGVVGLNVNKIKQLPATLGEVDILKTALLLPGVQTVGEGSAGFNVRGGSADQNLMLFDKIPIYNTSHLFGFFSVFNPETVDDFKLYKSGIPANYGGRVSSVFDVQAKQGNLKKYSLSAGISPVTSKLTVEGPLIKDKLSFVVGGRSTYSDWILKEINTPQTKNSSASFYDLSIKLSYFVNDKNELSLTSYLSKDNFSLNSDTSYHYANKCTRLYFKHFFTPKLYSKLSVIYSNYQYNIKSDEDPALSFNMKYNIEHKSVKADAHYFPNSQHNLVFGAEIIKYDLIPGELTPLLAESDISKIKLTNEHGIETGLYLSDEFKISDRLTASIGLRYAIFLALGSYKEYQYNPLVTRRVESRMDSTLYSKNEIVKTYGGPELRFSSRYILGVNNSVKFSYNRIHQFLHMISNSSAISPTDVWKICDPTIKPLIGDQLSLGYYHNFFSNELEASAEFYYKKTINQLDYKTGTQLLLNPDLDVSLLSGTGRAYGLELLLKKNQGKINGWLSYTYSKSEIKIDGIFEEEKINDGEYYPTDYDKTHDFTLVTNYKHSRRYSLSSTISYSTGRPISFPVAKYTFRNNQLLHYTKRNEYRIPDYFRWDLSLNIYENLKSIKFAHNFWSIGVYNVTGRNNAYSVYFKSNSSRGVEGYLLSVFSKPILNISYNIRF